MAYSYDYDFLEREYIKGDMSIRKLCRTHDIKGFSAVATYAREHGWNDKRAAIVARKEVLTIEKVAEKLATEESSMLMTVRDEMLTVVRAALYKFSNDLAEPDYHIAPRDLIELMKQGLLLIGEPTERTEEKSMALSGNLAELPADLLAELAGAIRSARTLNAEPGATGRAVPTLSSRTRTN